jgi:hypothetical protein
VEGEGEKPEDPSVLKVDINEDEAALNILAMINSDREHIR